VLNRVRLSAEDAQRHEIPLESPLYPTKFYILDEGLKPVPIGVGGELYIGGPTVNAGYVKRDEITSKAFLSNPFLSDTAEAVDGGRLYRTGDSFRLMRDGTIQALGRIGGDRQVKIRGMRTELDEIESVIYDACQSHDGLEKIPISLVAVVYHKTGDTEGVLAAHLAVSEDCVDDTEQQRSLRAYLHLRLRATLPVHMIPSAYVFLPELPRMVSGKIDYKAILAGPAPLPEAGLTNNARLGAMPLNDLQQRIAALWMKTLEFKGQLSPLDEFFAMGGHSLSLIHIQNGIRDQWNVDLSLGDMFASPTIEGMESLIVSHPNFADFTNGVKEESGKTAVVEDTFIDWAKESSFPDEFEWFVDSIKPRPTSAILITGALTMAGAHFIYHILLTTDLTIYCIGTEGTSDEDALEGVISNLKYWNLHAPIPETALSRLIVYAGSLSHPSLGLDDAQINRLDQEVQAIYQLDSDVSLLKRYESLRTTNVRSLEFLISLAYGKSNKIKSIHYLSTWGVPHLQAWNETQLSTPGWQTSEVEMSNMTPGPDGTLGYLKARWVCEALLSQAARRGIPVSIYRSCMCGSSPSSGVGLARTDINRRILEGSLQTGLVPDFGSARGGGMSWITADFLVESMFFLSQRKEGRKTGEASIHHIVSDQHIPYVELTKVLDVSHQGEELRSVLPEEWFGALRASGNPEMIMQAAVLESWCEAGWIPFALEAQETLELLKKERGLTPPKIDRDMLLKLVIGEKGF
jgi:thioester reductase-like protein